MRNAKPVKALPVCLGIPRSVIREGPKTKNKREETSRLGSGSSCTRCLPMSRSSAFCSGQALPETVELNHRCTWERLASFNNYRRKGPSQDVPIGCCGCSSDNAFFKGLSVIQVQPETHLPFEQCNANMENKYSSLLVSTGDWFQDALRIPNSTTGARFPYVK